MKMTVCFECGKDPTKICHCQHMEEQEYCTDCYTELHYYLTET